MYGVIYRATNLRNGKIYIGQTKSPLYKRIKEHNRNKNGSYFHNAIQQYGKYSFRWDILNIANCRDELNEMEIEAIAKYKSNNVDIGYNLTVGGENPLMSEETKKKLSVIGKAQPHRRMSLEARAKISMAAKGRIIPRYVLEKAWAGHTEDSYKRASEHLKGRKAWNKGMHYKRNTPTSDSTKEKIRAAAFKQWVGKTKRVMCIETGEIFESINKAQESYGIQDIGRACKGIRSHCGGYHWKYYEEAI